MPAALYLAALLLSHPLPTCLSAYGQTVCGFSCAASAGQVRCAATPAGICHSTAEGVVCFDPEGGWRLPRASCLVSAGVTACGYGCQAVGGDVKCAQTPYGLCIADFGRVDCWDPMLPLEQPPAEVPPAECVRDYGSLACGWGCAVELGQVRCSQVPGGRCRADLGRLVCDGG
ncbi:MAG: hypothetical protein IT380_11740 [Myxococcales bacterium]|nr:hypothetical protein [Myxococcales bacterium]